MRPACLVLGVALTAAPAGRAEDRSPATASLAWTRRAGGEDCIDAATLGKSVEQRLARRVIARRARADLLLDGEIGPAPGGGFVAEVVLRATDGRRLGVRTLVTRGEHCSSLDESVTLVVALLVDVLREEVRVHIPKETPAPREPVRFRVGASGAVAAGRIPGVGVGGRLHLGVAPPRFWPVELTLGLWLPAQARAGSGGAEFLMRSVGLAVCPAIAMGKPWRLDLCVGQQVGEVRAAGFGYDVQAAERRLVFDTGARLRASLALTAAFDLVAAAGADLVVFRDRFVFRGEDGRLREVYRPWPVAPALEAGVAVTF